MRRVWRRFLKIEITHPVAVSQQAVAAECVPSWGDRRFLSSTLRFPLTNRSASQRKVLDQFHREVSRSISLCRTTGTPFKSKPFHADFSRTSNHEIVDQS
jgi:hypothetical protein